MEYIRCFVVLLLCIALGCAEKEKGAGKQATSTTHPPVIFESEKLAYRVDTIAEGLENPWAIAFLPDGKMLVTERAGAVLIFQDEKMLEERIEIPDVYAHGQGGLMDIAVHPHYADSGWIYLSYAKKGEGGGGTVIVRTKLDGNQFTAFDELFAVQPFSTSGVNFGCRIAFDGDGHMFFSSGDRGTKEDAQSLSSHLGKIMRLRDNGDIPDDNPFVDSTDAKPEIWSYGHRNPQGLVYDTDTKTLWAADHGPRGGDELNNVEKGKNYGWPEITYGVNYDGTPITDKTAAADFEQPTTYWKESIGPCGMMQIKGDRYSSWKNDLLLATLTLKHILRLELNDGKYVSQEKLLGNIARVRAVEESPDGFIYVATEGPGMLLKVIPEEADKDIGK